MVADDRRVRWLLSLHDMCSSVDTCAFEERDAEQIRARLVPVVRDVLRLATTVLDRLLADFDGEPDPERGRNFQGHTLAQEIGDLCFLAKMELAPRWEELDRPRELEDKWALLGSCCHALGSVAKTVFALEPLLATVDGLPFRLQRGQSIDESVHVRRIYCNFHRQVTLGGEPQLGAVSARLTTVGLAIERLVSSPVYPSLRGTDRCHLRRLQERLERWQAAGDQADPVEGRRLWRDLATLSEMFQQINRRQELIDHDVELIHKLVARLEAGASDAEVLRDAAPLIGRDATLDNFIEEGTPAGEGALRELLKRIARGLVGQREEIASPA
jgi:hypothetical protein